MECFFEIPKNEYRIYVPQKKDPKVLIIWNPLAYWIWLKKEYMAYKTKIEPFIRHYKNILFNI